MSRIFRIITISIFLIGFPMVSWYYLNEGYKYRIGVIKELDQNLGNVPAFQLVNQYGVAINQDNLPKNAVITNFVDLETIDKSKAYMDILYKIQDQFDKKDDILFYTFIKGASLAEVQNYTKSLNIKEEKQWNFLTGDGEQMEQFINAFPFPEGVQKSYTGNSTVAIADTSSVIRFFYDMNDTKNASKLIEHIANLMPQAPPEEARMKRELEK